MSYERLTEHKKLCGIDYIKLKDCDRYDCEYCISPCDDAKDRLAELEDMIEDGVLVEKYFIVDEMLHDGKVMFNVAEYNPCTYVLISQHSTKAEAEEKLKEIRGE